MVLARIESGQLGNRFAHDDAGHQWKARHVPLGPEFMVGDILVTNHQVSRWIDVHDGRQVFHVPPLWVHLTDLFDVVLRLIEVELRQVGYQGWWHLEFLKVSKSTTVCVAKQS